jgi:hypothetical protein
VYSTAKAGLMGLTRSLARELAPECASMRSRRSDPVAGRRGVRRALAPAHHLAYTAAPRRHARRHREGDPLPARRGALRDRRDPPRGRRAAHRGLSHTGGSPGAMAVGGVSGLHSVVTAVASDSRYGSTTPCETSAMRVRSR